MAGGYRCSLGHTWNPTDGAAATACPVCGDTTIIVLAVLEKPLYVVAAGADPRSGQAATQSIALNVAVVSPDHAPTVAFSLSDTPPTDTPDPSFSSHAVLLPESSRSSGGAASSVVPFGVAEANDFAPPQVPGYEIIHEVGRGGMGVVYKARQLNLNRLIALKMILSGAHAGPAERERFKREAEAVAALQHAHIVQIFDIGEANGHPYLALEFVDGGSLAQALTGDPWASARAAELVEVLARTMQFAHDAGIVHRDLKPGNILLANVRRGPAGDGDARSSAGPRRPFAQHAKVTDFGLAKRLNETLGDAGTRTGAVMGTPSYIAPEQASGRTSQVGPAVDVYALGAILYELLTGRPPFRGETPLDTVLQVLHDDPVSPKRLHPLVPRDLETICLKCLSKNPAKRYATPLALADDLGRFLRGEPIKARPLSAWGRGVKWARRHPALAVLMCVTVVATAALVTVLSVAYAQVRNAVDEKDVQARVAQQESASAQDQKALAEAARKRAEELAAENDRRRQEAVQKADELKREADRTRRAAFALQLAQVAILCDRDPLRAAALLDDEARCPGDLRDFTWHYLRRLCQRDDRVYADHGPDDRLQAVAYSPSGTIVATAGSAGTIRIWDPRTGRTWAVLAGHTGAVHGLAFGPDGAVLASAGADGTVRLWVLPVRVLEMARRAMTAVPWLLPIVAPLVKAPALEPAITLADAHADGARCVGFSPDGRALVSGGRDGADGTIRWWDLSGWRATGVDVAGLGGPGAEAAVLTRARQSPGARPVWVASEFKTHRGGVLCLAFAQNGKFLVSGGADRMARVWAGDGSKLVRDLLPAHADAVRAVAVTPDGLTVATANNANAPTIRLFNTQTWRDRRLFGHTASIYALAVSDDGQVLASAGFDKTVRLWDVDDGHERGRLVGHAQQVNAVAFAPDRRTLVSAGADGNAIVWHTTPREHEPDDVFRFWREPAGTPTAQGLAAVGVGGAGAAFVTADDAGRVRILAADYAPPGSAVPPGPPGPLALSVLPYRTLNLKEKAHAAAASADGRSFAIATEHGLRVWQPYRPARGFGRDGAPPRGAFTASVLVRTLAPVRAVCFDPTGRWLAAADADGVWVYDMHEVPVADEHPVDLKGKRVLVSAGVRELAFHPNRGWLAVAVGTRVHVVPRDGKEPPGAPADHGPKAEVDAIAFDRAGGLMATGDASGRIKLWSLDAAGRPTFVRDLPGHTGAVNTLAFSADGRTLASGGDDRTVILWDPVAGQERLSLTGHADIVLKAAFNADGSALVTVSRDGAVKRWRADVRPPPAGSRLPFASHTPFSRISEGQN